MVAAPARRTRGRHRGARHRRDGPHLDDALPPPAGYVHCAVPMYAAQLADVVDACRTGTEPIGSCEVGRTALSIVERAYRHAAGVS